MPIIAANGNLLDCPARGLVNPANCGGIAGAGLARQFRERWPEQVAEYTAFCKAGRMRPGIIHDALLPDGRRILSVPTKEHWSDSSTIEIVGLGLAALKRYLDETGLVSIALPALGCGLGGLPKQQVAKLTRYWLGDNMTVVYAYGLEFGEGVNLRWKPPRGPAVQDGEYLLARLMNDEATGNRGAMLDVSRFTVEGQWLATVDRLLHFDRPEELLTELGYRRSEPWGHRDGIRSARVEREARE